MKNHRTRLVVAAVVLLTLFASLVWTRPAAGGLPNLLAEDNTSVGVDTKPGIFLLVKTLSFMLSVPSTVQIDYFIGQSHDCCHHVADSIADLRIDINGVAVHGEAFAYVAGGGIPGPNAHNSQFTTKLSGGSYTVDVFLADIALNRMFRITSQPQKITVNIDVKPGSDPNSINVKSQGVVSVCILTTPSFDASTVDPATVRFGRTGTEAAPVRSVLEDCDGDGDLDLVLHFNVQDTGFQAGDTKAILTGMTFGGLPINGMDAVRAFFPGDVNGDLRVDILDLGMAALAFDSTPESPKWNANADFDDNQVISIIDLATVALYYGERA